MPFIQRYSDVKKGGIVFTGNTLGLSKATNQNAPGTQGSIGAFTSLNTALQVGTFPLGTTLNYLQNGSQAILNLPASSTVLYAELVWGGLFRSTVNIRPYQQQRHIYDSSRRIYNSARPGNSTNIQYTCGQHHGRILRADGKRHRACGKLRYGGRHSVCRRTARCNFDHSARSNSDGLIQSHGKLSAGSQSYLQRRAY